MLKAIRKGITLDMARNTFRLLHQAGIFSIGFFMFGNQGESEESIERTIDFMHELNPALCSPSTFRPFPGTEAYKFVKAEDRYWWMGTGYPSICKFTIDELHHIREEAGVWYPLRLKYITQHILSRKKYGLTAWKMVRIHMLKVMLGISEQSRPVRILIHGIKRIQKRIANPASTKPVSTPS